MIQMMRSPDADTRSATGEVEKEAFERALRMHKIDVKNIMFFLANRLKMAGLIHDYTKVSKFDQFFTEFNDAKRNNTSFKDSDWYQYHITKERHHIKSFVHDDINLLDVMEMISDCVAAGKARSGKVYDIDIDPEVLMKAYENTVKLIMENTEVVG